MVQEKLKFYFTFFFAIRGDESRTFSTSNLNLIKNKYLMRAEGLFQTMEKEQIKHVITFHELIINCKLFKIIFEKVCRKHKKRYNGAGENKILFYFLLRY